MRGRTGKIEILILLMTVLRPQIPHLPEVVTQSKGRASHEIKTFLPDFGIVHNLKLNVFFEIGHTQFLCQTIKYGLAGAIDKRLPVLLVTGIQMADRHKSIKAILSLWGCSRIRSRDEAFRGGMPTWKYFANRFLTAVENFALGQNLGDFHSGFRVYRREVLERIPFEKNSDDFVFDTQFLVQAVRLGFRLGDIPVPVRYFKEASSINFRRSVRYGLGTLATVGSYWLDRLGIRRSPLFRAKNGKQS